MIEVNSFINSVGDYAFDCELRHDILLRDTKYTGNVVVINTEMCSIVVTDDTMLMNDRGLWKYASKLQVGNALKSYMTNRVVQPSAKPEKPERPERQPRRKKETSGNRGRRGTPTAKQPVQKGKMSPRKKAAFAKKRNGK